jgi:hypothetical protein
MQVASQAVAAPAAAVSQQYAVFTSEQTYSTQAS